MNVKSLNLYIYAAVSKSSQVMCLYVYILLYQSKWFLRLNIHLIQNKVLVNRLCTYFYEY